MVQSIGVCTSMYCREEGLFNATRALRFLEICWPRTELVEVVGSLGKWQCESLVWFFLWSHDAAWAGMQSVPLLLFSSPSSPKVA